MITAAGAVQPHVCSLPQIAKVFDQMHVNYCSLFNILQVPAPSSWADGLAPEKVLKALEDMQQSQPNTDAEAMRFAISVSELQPDTGEQTRIKEARAAAAEAAAVLHRQLCAWQGL